MILRRRALRSAQWGCQEVQAACEEQFRQMDVYQSQVSLAITVITPSLPASSSTSPFSTPSGRGTSWARVDLTLQRSPRPLTRA